MRPIRFRAYDKVAGYMFDPGIVSLHQDRDIHSITVISSLGDEKTVPIEQVDLMQFIGQYDKHGKEIYENDIVKLTCHTACSTDGSTSNGTISGVVEYDVVGFGLKCDMYFFPFASMYQVYDIEVIGNIYQDKQ